MFFYKNPVADSIIGIFVKTFVLFVMIWRILCTFFSVTSHTPKCHISMDSVIDMWTYICIHMAFPKAYLGAC